MTNRCLTPSGAKAPLFRDPRWVRRRRETLPAGKINGWKREAIRGLYSTSGYEEPPGLKGKGGVNVETGRARAARASPRSYLDFNKCTAAEYSHDIVI